MKYKSKNINFYWDLDDKFIYLNREKVGKIEINFRLEFENWDISVVPIFRIKDIKTNISRYFETEKITKEQLKHFFLKGEK